MRRKKTKYVFYQCSGGLGNRLRLHCVAHAYAIKTGRNLIADWKVSRQCPVTYHDLFVDGPISYKDLSLYKRLSFQISMRVNCTTFGQGDLSNGKSVQCLPNSKKELVFISKNIEASLEDPNRLGDYRKEVLSKIIPKPEMSEKADQFISKIQGPKVGIHIRVNDFFNKKWKSPSLDRYIAIAKAIQKLQPNTTFIVVSDGCEKVMRPLYESVRSCFRSKINHRKSKDGIKDALVDILTLSKTALIVGTPHSSFGSFAAFYAGKPYLWAVDNWQNHLKNAWKVVMNPNEDRKEWFFGAPWQN